MDADAVDLVDEPEIADAVHQAQRQHHDEAGAQHHLADVEPGARPQLGQLSARVEPGRDAHPRRGDRRLSRRGGAFAGLAGPA